MIFQISLNKLKMVNKNAICHGENKTNKKGRLNN